MSRITIIKLVASKRAKTNIGGSYTVYLSADRYFLKDEDSMFAAVPLSLMELGRMLMAEEVYNLSRVGLSMRTDLRWRALFHRAEHDNIDCWDETGDEMKAIETRHAELRKELITLK